MEAPGQGVPNAAVDGAEGGAMGCATSHISKYINTDKQIAYLLSCIAVLPEPYASLDTNRLTLAYFCVSALDVLGQLDRIDAPSIIRWVYSLQVLPADDSNAPPECCGGFRGSGYMGAPFDERGSVSSCEYDSAHIAMTYTALAVLLILGDDLSRVKRESALRFVSALQDGTGCFAAYSGGERDMRFLFCATAICAMLGDARCDSIDVSSAAQYVCSSQAFDGGLGLGPGMESHGGSTYTGLAALSLMGKIHMLERKDKLVQWCVERQVSGFQGRPNKAEDTCYSFWIGASLELLGAHRLTHLDALSQFAHRCQYKYGGIAKCTGSHPDVLHTYFALCGLSLAGVRGLEPIDARLGVSLRAATRAGLAAPDATCALVCETDESPTEVAMYRK